MRGFGARSGASGKPLHLGVRRKSSNIDSLATVRLNIFVCMVARKSSARPRRSGARRKIVWEVYRLKGSPAAYMGTVRAADENAALAAAIEWFEVPPAHRDRLLIRRQA